MDKRISSSCFAFGEIMHANNLDMVHMQKPARKQGRNIQLEHFALAYARASALHLAIIKLDLRPNRRTEEMFSRAPVHIKLTKQFKTPASRPHRAPPLQRKRLL